MPLKRSTRRFLSALFVLIGAGLIFLATAAWLGVMLVALGMSIELIAITLKLWKD